MGDGRSERLRRGDAGSQQQRKRAKDEDQRPKHKHPKTRLPAPKEVRGEFTSIATKVPGIRVCEHLPRSSRVVDKLAIVRSVHHPMRNHNSAAVEALCGRTPLGGDQELLNDDANSFPCYGAVLNHLRPGRRTIPTHVALPHVMYNVVRLPGQTAGFLGPTQNPSRSMTEPPVAKRPPSSSASER